jgi:hypothetical protein
VKGVNRKLNNTDRPGLTSNSYVSIENRREDNAERRPGFTRNSYMNVKNRRDKRENDLPTFLQLDDHTLIHLRVILSDQWTLNANTVVLCTLVGKSSQLPESIIQSLGCAVSRAKFDCLSFQSLQQLSVISFVVEALFLLISINTFASTTQLFLSHPWGSKLMIL